MQQRSSDGAWALARTDHSDRRRLEKVRDGRHRGDAIALLEPPARLLIDSRRQLDRELSALGADLGGKAAVAEHVDHRVVLRQDHRRERVDALRSRLLRQLAEQDGADTTSLPRVGDLERDLRASVALAGVEGVTDDRAGVAGDRYEASNPSPAVGGGVGCRVHVRAGREEAKPARLDR